ncbi:hypothetical protein [Streptomyces sp. RK75]|uniref:hypothetical protein n=1 Tax=Streptomyces sp. RK75 TaxID=2824895 RepID=UPI001B399F92|nr:hypothetical protein [Streptomyces sp. RK75]MBQ0867998.1 hypothetical protein [Streptomyces sp. RK75]
MTDSYKAAVLAAVAGGYFLGRTRKAKLALTVGSVVAGRRLGLDPQELLRQGIQKLAETPQFEELTDQVKHQLVAAARTAVSSTANRRLESLADALRDRRDRLGGEGGQDEDQDEDQGQGQDQDDGQNRGRDEDDEGRNRGRDGEEAEKGGGGRRSSSGADASSGRRKEKPSSDRPRKRASSGDTGRRSSSDGSREKSADRSERRR